MNRENIKDTILDFLKRRTKISVENLNTGTSLIKEYGLNSINIVELIVEIEEKFCIEFDDTELDLRNYECIDSIIDTVLKHNCCKQRAAENSTGEAE